MAVTGPAGMGRKLGALRRFAAAGCRSVAIPVDRHTRRRHAVGICRNFLASPCNRGWFPLSLLISGSVALPAWAWLLPLLLVAIIYPVNAWRDAPLFPTPSSALIGLAERAPLADGARILDAGCGLGDGLIALRAAYPAASLFGVEWSWPLRGLTALRCPWARISQGDMWKIDWSQYDMVYLFQRPETMPRAVEKARAELRSGCWLVSLEFLAEELKPTAQLNNVDGKPVWLYRAPFK